jgi:hypothetical protein
MRILWTAIIARHGPTKEQHLVPPALPSRYRGPPQLWPNMGLDFYYQEIHMGNKIVTEADRKRTPRPKPLPGMSLPTPGRGQHVSLERGTATRSKKNPGKRSKKGG